MEMLHLLQYFQHFFVLRLEPTEIVVFIIHVENIVRIRIAQRMVFMADDEKNTKKWFTKDVLGEIIFTILDTFKILTVTISQNMLNCLKLHLTLQTLQTLLTKLTLLKLLAMMTLAHCPIWVLL